MDMSVTESAIWPVRRQTCGYLPSQTARSHFQPDRQQQVNQTTRIFTFEFTYFNYVKGIK